MSAALATTAAPTIPRRQASALFASPEADQRARLPRTAHPLPLREQAFALHCQGLRSPAIATTLGIPQRTVRAWIAAALHDLAADHALSRREQLLVAVESQRAISAAAWQQFEAETAPALAADNPSGSTPRAPRYLTLAHHAQREIARLLGLYQLARLDLLPDRREGAALTFADAGDPFTVPTDEIHPADAAESATALPVRPPASTSAASLRDLCADNPPHCPSPASSTTPAKTATPTAPRPTESGDPDEHRQARVPRFQAPADHDQERPQKRQNRQPAFAIPRARQRR